MPAYNFMPRFAVLVETGAKTQTIRKTDRRAKPGDIAFLYTGQRTKHCRLLGKGVIKHVQPVELGRRRNGLPYARLPMPKGQVFELMTDSLDALARADGFADGDKMVRWFDSKYGLPFHGFVHAWTLL